MGTPFEVTSTQYAAGDLNLVPPKVGCVTTHPFPPLQTNMKKDALETTRSFTFTEVRSHRLLRWLRSRTPGSREDAGGWQARDASGWELSEVQVLRGADRFSALGLVRRPNKARMLSTNPDKWGAVPPKVINTPLKRKQPPFNQPVRHYVAAFCLLHWVFSGLRSAKPLHVYGTWWFRGLLDANAGRVVQAKGSVD